MLPDLKKEWFTRSFFGAVFHPKATGKRRIFTLSHVALVENSNSTICPFGSYPHPENSTLPDKSPQKALFYTDYSKFWPRCPQSFPQGVGNFSGKLWKSPQERGEFSTGVKAGRKGDFPSVSGGRKGGERGDFFFKKGLHFRGKCAIIGESIPYPTYPWHSWIARQTPTLKVEGSNPFG